MEEIYFCPNCMAKITPGNGKCPECGGDINIENAPHQLPVNSILNGRYLIGRVLGAGGFGITYIGYDLKNNCRVAIKEYYPSGAANRSTASTVFPTSRERGNPFEVGKDRFLKEARTLSGFVEDKNIVTLKDYFEENGTAYIVMEYLDGVDLGRYAKEHGRLELDAVLTMLEPAMLALDKVHKKGLIHRDISPSNLMLLKDGSVKVLDFGSARMQNIEGELSLSVMLKPGFAPEEQYRTHGEQGSWTDVYAMSATIYRLITGKAPPSSTDRAFEDTIELPSKLGVEITPSQEQALMRGLAVRATDRTQTMAELAESLHVKKKAAPKPSHADEHKKENKPKTSAALKKRLIAAGAAVLALLMLCVCVSTAKRSAEKAIAAEEQQRHMDELAIAREAIAPHRETTISTVYHTVGLKSDGTVVAVGENDHGQCNVSDWTDIVAISPGVFYTVGLKADGTVVAVGSGDYDGGSCDVSDWTDIVAVSAGFGNTIGLKSDGMVVAAGWNDYGQCDVANWTGIVAVSVGDNHTVGLKADGTVLAVGKNDCGQCNVGEWKNIIAISAGYDYTVGLKVDGTLVAVGENGCGQCDVSDWTGIVAVSAGVHHTVGLKADGTVVAVGYNGGQDRQCDVSYWTDIVAVSAGSNHTVGLKSDGTVVATGNNYSGRCDVSDWRNIKLPDEELSSKSSEQTDEEPQMSIEELAAAREAIAPHRETTISAAYHTVGLKSDGTVVAVGCDIRDECDVTDWKDIAAVTARAFCTVGVKLDGTAVATGDSFSGVSEWTDIVAVGAGMDHVVGLKSDGTVVAVGDNSNGQCNVDNWENIVAIDADTWFTVGLKSDGTVVAVGANDNGQCNVGDWKDIVSISAGSSFAVGLRADGTVVANGDSINITKLSQWENIVAVSGGGLHVVGLKANGTVVATGVDVGQLDVSGWTDIVAVSAGNGCTIGLKSNGTVVAAGDNEDGECEVSNWRNIKLP